MTEHEALQTPSTPVVLDTDVFSRLLVSRGGRKPTAAEQSNRDHWGRVLTGRTLVISAQTRAELLAWPLAARWSQDRSDKLEAIISGVGIIPLDDAVQRTYAQLKAWAKPMGHAIQDKVHTADRWIAASAIANGLPLATEDHIFDSVPALVLLPRS